MIEVHSLHHRYGPLTAVHELSFSLRRGERLGLLGPNGAGKSTTMRAVVGLLRPSAGQIRVGGVDQARDPLRTRAQIGYLPEQVPLYRELKVREFLAFAARAKGLPKAAVRAEIERVSELCGLQSVIERMIGFCSRGFRQRIGLAQALLCDPPVLVLDEPTVGLDPEQVAGIRERIETLSQDKAVILSTHVLAEAQRLCTRVLILHEGRCVAESDTTRLGARVAKARWRAVLQYEAPDLEARLHDLALLRSFTRLEKSPERSVWRFELRPAASASEFLTALVREGCAVEEFGPERLELEELFLRAIHGELRP
jgi:ABC-2 type transport system ATP-binding protein